MLTTGTRGVVELTESMEALRSQGEYAAARSAGRAGRDQVTTARDAELLDVALALATYKDPEYSVRLGLHESLALLTKHTEKSDDPETLAVAGAVEKRLYEIDLRIEHLERSADFYARGHELDRRLDWPRFGYPGINAAHTFEVLAKLRPDVRESLRQRVLELWKEIIAIPGPSPAASRSERYFHAVTLADALLGLGLRERGLAELTRARAIEPEGWQLETSARQLASNFRLRSADGRVDEAGREALTALLGADAGAVSSAIRGKVGLALSGGGFRASLFHIGVLAWLAEVDLLRHIEVISCVSGGSLLGASYYLELQKLYTDKGDAQLTRRDFVDIVLRLAERFPKAIQSNLRTRLLFDPEGNATMLRGDSSRTIEMGKLYEEYLYAQVADSEPKRTPRYMDELVIEPSGTSKFRPAHDNWRRRARVPAVVLNAASLNTGHSWHFSAYGMGEPPARVDEDIDVNDRFARQQYRQFPQKWQRFRLGHAAAASACVPGLFEPLELSGAYGSHVVRLVDGGLHDNQGAGALLEQDCTALIMSDGSGQMSLLTNPKGSALEVVLRSNSVLQARVREAQYLDLRNRERGKLLRSFSFLHLKQGVAPRSLEPSAATGAAELQKADLGYGVSQAVQERLAGLRTDLDAFSDLEAQMLMTSGYLMAQSFVDTQTLEVSEGDSKTREDATFPFLQVRPLMLAQPNSTATETRILQLLDVGSSVFGKAFLVSDQLRNIAYGALAAVGLVLSALIYEFWSSEIFHITVSAAALTLLSLVLVWRIPQVGPWLDAISPKRSLVRELKVQALSVAAALVARCSVRFADPIFLNAGRVEPLLRDFDQETKSGGSTKRALQ